jgi:hypothetical protein
MPLSVRALKQLKRACMTRGRTLVKAWKGTFDEAEFCPPIYPMRHIYSMKREGATDGTALLLLVMDKNGEDHCSLYLLR